VTDYLIRPDERVAFATERFTRNDLARGARLFLGLNCFEAGQTQAAHTHADADKFYLVRSGKARMTVGDATFLAAEGDVVWCPAGVPHGVEEALERTVLLIAMAPPPGK
jgi:quercetin dioxygenase-like cupin family protein